VIFDESALITWNNPFNEGELISGIDQGVEKQVERVVEDQTPPKDDQATSDN